MGLSSSQARLLTLTGRMHEIEYKAAKLEAQKLQMANESKRVYDDYLNALEAKKVQMKTIDNKGAVAYIDATYNRLTALGYVLKMDGDDAEIVTQDIIDNYKKATDNESSFGTNNRECFAALQTGRVDSNMMNGDVLEIYTAGQLAEAFSSSQTGITCRLMGDIDMSSTLYEPGNITNCQIDGNGHSISGLSTNLFNIVKNSTISNLRLSGNVTSGRGMLANNVNQSNISNITASGSVTAIDTNKVGGLVGQDSGGSTYENCSIGVNVNGSQYVGGFIGMVSGSSGAETHINNCVATGNVTGQRNAGGFIGNTSYCEIRNSKATGNVTATFIDYQDTSDWSNTMYNHETKAGGFIGVILRSTNIYNSEATGDVHTAGELAGGFVGQIWNGDDNILISGCNSSGSVYFNEGNEDIVRNNESIVPPGTGTVRPIASAGGFIGTFQAGSAVNCNSNSNVVNVNGNRTFGSFVGTPTTEVIISSGASVLPSTTNCYAIDIPTGAGTAPFSGNNASTIQTNPAVLNSNTVTPAAPTISTNIEVDDAGGDDARALFDRMKENGYALLPDDDPRISHGDDPVWLTNMINEGKIYIYKPNHTNGDIYETSVSTDTNLQEVPDEINLRKAEAKYEADMLRIDKKDRIYDHELAALDNERNAIKQEMETLKTVAKENVERTFKLFG